MNNTQDLWTVYKEKQADIETLLARVQVAVNLHEQGTNGRAHWGHVGDLNHTKQQLIQALNALGYGRLVNEPIEGE